MIVYLIRNIVNGKLYFGITKFSIKKRWSEHKSSASRSIGNTFLSNAIRKYGHQNFTIQIVRNCLSENEMYELEIKLINRFKTTNRLLGYNNSTGGEISSKGRKASIEQRKKLSIYQSTRKRKPHSEETKNKLRDKGLGRDMTSAVIASIKIRLGKSTWNKKGVILNGVEKYKSISNAAKIKNCSVSLIWNNLNGHSKTTKFGIWQYDHQN
jgi:group I intron endonuclease